MVRRPVHLLADRKDIAEIVVACGDPGRARQLSGLLGHASLVNDNRGFATYTGDYKGRRVTVTTHGIGGPSAAIVFEELRMLGAKQIVRLGTMGGLANDLEAGDFVIPTAAAYPNGSLPAYIRGRGVTARPDSEVSKRIIERCESERMNCRTGLVVSSDSFYGEDDRFVRQWVGKHAIGVEMECATLFTLAKLRGFKSAALLVVSNNKKVKGSSTGSRFATDEVLRPYVITGGRVVLEALTTVGRRKV